VQGNELRAKARLEGGDNNMSINIRLERARKPERGRTEPQQPGNGYIEKDVGRGDHSGPLQLRAAGTRQRRSRITARLDLLLLAISVSVAVTLCGCSSKKPKAQQREFFTSGSKEADQRASQRMAKEEQLTGQGEGSGEKGVKKAKKTDSGTSAGGTKSLTKPCQLSA
jgi:hypothetical protein